MEKPKLKDRIRSRLYNSALFAAAAFAVLSCGDDVFSNGEGTGGYTTYIVAKGDNLGKIYNSSVPKDITFTEFLAYNQHLEKNGSYDHIEPGDTVNLMPKIKGSNIERVYKREMTGDYGNLVLSVQSDQNFHKPFPNSESYVGNERMWRNFGDFLVINSENILSVYDACGITSKTDPQIAVAKIVKFVHQNLKYISDEDEFIRSSSQTIINGGGDCEDLSGVMANMLLPLNRLYGEDVIDLALVVHSGIGDDPGHTLLSVAGVDVEEGAYLEFADSDKQYFLLECTNANAVLGSADIPDGVDFKGYRIDWNL